MAASERVVWRRNYDDKSFEFLELRRDEHEIAGQIIAAENGVPSRVDYTLVCNADMSAVKSARFERKLGGDKRALTVESAGAGAWRVDGAAAPALDGCTDIDIEWTPATNMFPVRRLKLALGQSAEIKAAWVRMPGLTIEPSAQRYTRLADARYRYESLASGFTAEITVDDFGLPIDYVGIWTRIAAWP